MRSRLEELFGGGLALSTTAGSTLRAPLPFGQGGARHLLIDVTGGATPAVLELPDTTWLQAGGRRLYTVVPYTGKVEIQDSTGTSYGVFDASLDEAAWIYLVDDSTLAGSWQVRRRTEAERGAAIPATREVFDLTLDTTDLDGFDLREWANSSGFNGRTPVGIRCTIKAGVVIGSETTSEFAFRTGVFPVGSTLLLKIESGGHIAGRGGNGGRGQAGVLIPGGNPPEAGAAGGDALKIEMNTWLINSGRISGGGGGGSGGIRNGAVGGGGGGGGAGYIASLGGAGGLGGGQPGQPGSLELGGAAGNAGGPYSGGTGGLAGQTGQAAGAAGGAAGRAIVRVSGYSLTKIRAGTIEGAEVVV